MAVHEITEHPDGSAEEYHSFSAEEWREFSEWLARGGTHAHPDMNAAVQHWTTETARQDRTTNALAAVFAVAQYDRRFKLEVI